jgi:hypothetical protein
MNDAFQEHFFRGDQGKSGTQIKTHLMTKNAVGACARSIGFEPCRFLERVASDRGTVACTLPSLCKGRY